jgi:Mrp family chromosome partitioning ATPase
LLSILLDFRDRTIRRAEDIEQIGLECIGAVPRIGGSEFPRSARWLGQRDLDSWVIDHPGSMLYQTLRRVRAVVQCANIGTIGITSLDRGEGATTLAYNLAHLLAMSGKRVLFIDALGRSSPGLAIKPSRAGTAKAHNLPSAPDIAVDARSSLHVLETEGGDMADAASAWVTHLDKPEGAIAPYDIVIVDLPPLAAELRPVAQKLQGILLVLKWGHGDRDKIQRAINSAGIPRSKFIGVVLNMVDGRLIGSYGNKFWGAEAAAVALRRAFAVMQRRKPQTARVRVGQQSEIREVSP